MAGNALRALVVLTSVPGTNATGSKVSVRSRGQYADFAAIGPGDGETTVQRRRNVVWMSLDLGGRGEKSFVVEAFVATNGERSCGGQTADDRRR